MMTRIERSGYFSWAATGAVAADIATQATIAARLNCIDLIMNVSLLLYAGYCWRAHRASEISTAHVLHFIRHAIAP